MRMLVKKLIVYFAIVLSIFILNVNDGYGWYFEISLSEEKDNTVDVYLHLEEIDGGLIELYGYQLSFYYDTEQLTWDGEYTQTPPEPLHLGPLPLMEEHPKGNPTPGELHQFLGISLASEGSPYASVTGPIHLGTISFESVSGTPVKDEMHFTWNIDSNSGLEATNLAIVNSNVYEDIYYLGRELEQGNTEHARIGNGLALPPVAPDELVAKVISGDRVDLTWNDNSDDELGFRVERRKEELVSKYERLDSAIGTDETSYSDTTTEIDNTYYYRIVAYGPTGSSPYSNEVKVTTNETVPEAPDELTGKVRVNKKTPSKDDTEYYPTIILHWKDNSQNEQGFSIERKEEGGNFSEITTRNADITHFEDEDVVFEKNYVYRIAAYNANGFSEYSGELAVTTALPPRRPGHLAVEVELNNSVKLTWKDNAYNEAGFKVEQKEGDGDYSEIATLNPDTVSYTDSGLTPEIKYTYRIFAFNDTGNSEYSDEASVTIETVPPSAPSGLTAKVTQSVIGSLVVELTWFDNSDNEDGFEIERKTSDGSYSLKSVVKADKTSLTDSDYSNDTNYVYRIRAFNDSGYSDYSNEAFTVPSTYVITPLRGTIGTEFLVTSKENNFKLYG